MRSKARALAAGLLLAVLVAAGCSRAESAPAKKGVASALAPVAVRLAPVRRVALPRHVPFLGTLFADEEAVIAAKFLARIRELPHDVGDRVEPGAVLAQLEDTDAKLLCNQKEMAFKETLAHLGLTAMPPADFDLLAIPAVQRAKLQLANAEAKFVRGKALYEGHPRLLSDEEYQDQQTAAEIARSEYRLQVQAAEALVAEARSRAADLEVVRQQLADTTIYAPRAPHVENYAVAARYAMIGQFVREDTPLYRLVDDDPIKLRVPIGEKYLADVALGQEALVTVYSYDREFTGKVSRINPAVDAQSRTFEVEIVVPNTDRKLRPGAFAKGNILAGSDANVRVVPAAAVTSFAGVLKVFTVRAGKAAEVRVETGRHQGDDLEITKGLPDDVTLVIVSDLNQLATGVPVTTE